MPTIQSIILFLPKMAIISDGHRPGTCHPRSIPLSSGAVAENISGLLPQLKVGPNPCREAIRFTLDLPAACDIHVEIFNSLGQKVKSLTNRVERPGQTNISLKLGEETGKKLSAGAYFYRVSVAKNIHRDKFILAR